MIFSIIKIIIIFSIINLIEFTFLRLFKVYGNIIASLMLNNFLGILLLKSVDLYNFNKKYNYSFFNWFSRNLLNTCTYFIMLQFCFIDFYFKFGIIILVNCFQR